MLRAGAGVQLRVASWLVGRRSGAALQQLAGTPISKSDTTCIANVRNRGHSVTVPPSATSSTARSVPGPLPLAHASTHTGAAPAEAHIASPAISAAALGASNVVPPPSRDAFRRPAGDVTSAIDAFLPLRLKREMEMRIVHDAARLSLSYLRNVVSTNARTGFAKRIPAPLLGDVSPAIASMYGAGPILPGGRRKQAAVSVDTAQAWTARSLAGRGVIHHEWIPALIAMRVLYAAQFPDRVVVPRRLSPIASDPAFLAAVVARWQQRGDATMTDEQQRVYDSMVADSRVVVYALRHELQVAATAAPKPSSELPFPDTWRSFINTLHARGGSAAASRRALVTSLVTDTHPAHALCAPLLIAYLGDKDELLRCMGRISTLSEDAAIRQAAFLMNELAVNTIRRNAVTGDDTHVSSAEAVLSGDSGLSNEVITRLQRIFASGSQDTSAASGKRGSGKSKAAQKADADDMALVVREMKKTKRFRGAYDTAVYSPDAWLDALHRLGFSHADITAAIPAELQHTARAAASAWTMPPAVTGYLALLRNSVLMLRQRYVFKGKRLRALPPAATPLLLADVQRSIDDVSASAPAAASSAALAALPSSASSEESNTSQQTGAAPSVHTLLALSRIGLPKMTKAALTAGGRKVLAFIAAHASAEGKFAFRRCVAELEAHRATITPVHVPAKTNRAAAATLAGRIVDEADFGGADFVYTDMFQSDTTRELLRQAVACVPPQQRQAIYPRLLRYMGVLRLSDVDARLFGVNTPVKRPASAPSLKAAATPATGAAVSSSTEPVVGPPKWSSVWSALNQALDDARAPAPAPVVTAPPEFDPMVEQHDLYEMELLLPPSEPAAAPPTPVLAPQAPPPLQSVDAMSVARRLTLMLNSRDFERLCRLLKNHMSVNRRLERKWCDVVAARFGGSVTPADAPRAAIPVGTRSMYLQDLLAERVLTTARAASGIFGPLACMLDADFLAALRTGDLSIKMLSAARRVTLLQDAQMSISEELLLDQEANAADSPDMLLHADRVLQDVDTLPAGNASLPSAEMDESELASKLSARTPAGAVVESVRLSFQKALLPLLLPRVPAPADGADAPVISPAQRALAEDLSMVRTAAAAAAAAVEEAKAAVIPAPEAAPPAGHEPFQLVGPWARTAQNEPFDSWGRVGVTTSKALFDDAHTQSHAAADVAESAAVVDEQDPVADADGWDAAAEETGRPAGRAIVSFDDHETEDALISVSDPGPALQRVHTYLAHTITVPLRVQVRALKGVPIDTDASHSDAVPHVLERSDASGSPIMPLTYPHVSFTTYGVNAGGTAVTATGTQGGEDSLEWNTPAHISCKVMVNKLPFSSRPEDIVTAFNGCGRVTRVEIWRDRADAMHKKLAAQEVFLQQKSRWQVTDKLIKAHDRSVDDAPAAAAPHMPSIGDASDDDANIVFHAGAARAVASAAPMGARAFSTSTGSPSEHAALQQLLQQARDEIASSTAAKAAAAAAKAAAPTASAATGKGKKGGKADAAVKKGKKASPKAAAKAVAAPAADTPKAASSAPKASGKPKTVRAAGASATDRSDGLDDLRPRGPLTTRRMNKAFEDRRRKYNMVSPLHAFVYFDARASAEAATTDTLRLFGIVIHNQACRTEMASACRMLYIGNAWRGMPPDAALAALDNMLASAGFSVSLLDSARLRMGMLSNGEMLLEFGSHADAVRAAHALRGAQVQPGLPLVVGWATSEEWTAARPKMPVYF